MAIGGGLARGRWRPARRRGRSSPGEILASCSRLSFMALSIASREEISLSAVLSFSSSSGVGGVLERLGAALHCVGDLVEIGPAALGSSADEAVGDFLEGVGAFGHGGVERGVARRSADAERDVQREHRQRNERHRRQPEDAVQDEGERGPEIEGFDEPEAFSKGEFLNGGCASRDHVRRTQRPSGSGRACALGGRSSLRCGESTARCR